MLVPVTPLAPIPGVLPLKYTYSNNKSSDAALRFLLEHDDDGLSQLVGLCVIACRGLYFPDAWARYNASGTKMFGQDEVVRDFIVGWLGNELAKYRGKFADEIQSAEPQLRHIPRRCRLAILNQIRKCPACGQRKTKECLGCDHIFTHREMNTKATVCPKCGSDDLHVVCRHKCATPSVRTSLDMVFSSEDGEGKNKLIEYVVGQTNLALDDNTPNLPLFLVDSRPLLDAIHPHLADFLTVVFRHFAKRGQKRYLTRKWAEHLGVSLKVARKVRKEILRAVKTEMHRPVLRELYLQLEHSQDNLNEPVLAIPISKRTVQAMQAKREASQLIREAERESGTKGLAAVEPERTCFDYDPPIPGEDPEVRSSTLFASADGGMREVSAQEELESMIKDVGDEDDVRAFFGLEEGEQIPLKADTETMRGDSISYDGNTGYDVESDD